MRAILSRLEREIIITLISERRPLSLHKISKISGIAWVTVRKYMIELVKKNVVEEYGFKYRIDPNLLDKVADVIGSA